MDADDDKLLTLQDVPRLYLKNRAARMIRLVELDAELNIIENEYWLITAAMVALRAKERA